MCPLLCLCLSPRFSQSKASEASLVERTGGNSKDAHGVLKPSQELTFLYFKDPEDGDRGSESLKPRTKHVKNCDVAITHLRLSMIFFHVPETLIFLFFERDL